MWITQLTIAINFFSSKDDNDDMHSKSDKIKIMICDEAGEVIKKILIRLKIDIKIILN